MSKNDPIHIINLNWQGWNGTMSALKSIKEHRFAIKKLSKKEDIYDCYLPHPEDNNSCIYLPEVKKKDIYNILIYKNLLADFSNRVCMSFDLIVKSMSFDEILQLIWSNYDIADFFDLTEEGSEAIPVDSVIEIINNDSTSKDPVSLTPTQQPTKAAKIPSVNFRVTKNTTFLDILLAVRGLTSLPDYLWQLKVTDEEYIRLKEYIKEALFYNKAPGKYNREVALYLAEFHRREFDSKERNGDDSGPTSAALDALNLGNTNRYDYIKRKFVDGVKDGASRINAEIFKSNGKSWYVYSLMFNGGLPLKKCLNVDNNPSWKRLIRRIITSEERIEFDDELQDLLSSEIAKNLSAFKAFCQQLQEALILEDYKELPFYCNSEDDPYCQFFLKYGKDVLTELKSENPFQIDWLFEINMHRKVIIPKYKVTGPDAIPLSSNFVNDSDYLKTAESFNIVTSLDSVEIDSIIYNRTERDFYGSRSLEIESNYNDCSNIIVKCLETNTVYASEELDIQSPQLVRRGENNCYIISSNRFIGHRETIVIIPEGWKVENSENYKIESGYSFLGCSASILIIPVGVDRQSIVLTDEKGNHKTFSASVSINKFVVMKPSMSENVKQNVYFDIASLPYFVKRQDGTSKPMTCRNLLFCNDRRTNEWTEDAPLGYVFVKPQEDRFNADPIRILNLGKFVEDFKLRYLSSTADRCIVDIVWRHGEVNSSIAQHSPDQSRWIIKKEDCIDSRYVDFVLTPDNGRGKSFCLSVKTHFRDFSIYDSDGNMPSDNSYISYVQLPNYTYHLQDVDVKITLKIHLFDENFIKYKYTINGTQARNGKVPVVIDNCKDQRSTSTSVLTESSFDCLLGGMDILTKYLYSSPHSMRDAEIELIIRYNGRTLHYHIKKYPYHFIKEGFNKITILDQLDQIIDYNGTVRALPLYNYDGVQPIDITKDENGEFIIPEEAMPWDNILLISGLSELVLPHMVVTSIEGEVDKEELSQRITTTFLPMLKEEYPASMIWDKTWHRCLYWYHTAIREHIPADSLFDLKCTMSSSSVLVRFVFNLFLNGLLERNFEDYKDNLKRQLEAFSRSNSFLWIWVSKDDYKIESLMPYIDLLYIEPSKNNSSKSKDLLLGWYSYTRNVQGIMSIISNNEITLDKIKDFLFPAMQEFYYFMDELRSESFKTFISGNKKNITAGDILTNKKSKNYSADDIFGDARDWDRLPLLTQEQEDKYFKPLLAKSFAPNYDHFSERATMMISHMKGEYDIFTCPPHVRRSVLYYTSYYKDKFIKLMLNETTIQ